MKIQKRKLIGAAIAASALIYGGTLAAHDSLSPEHDAQVRAIAYSSTLARFVSTNCLAFAASLAPSARDRWLKEEPIFRVKDVQLFLPDFFKVAYVYNGSVEDDVFCFGLYNPFYDHMLLCKASGLKNTEVIDYKWVSGSALRGDKDKSAYPLSMGVNPSEEYFPSMLKVLGRVIKNFNRRFVGVQPDEAFSELEALDGDGVKKLVGIAVRRTAQGVEMAGDKQAFGLATLMDLIARDDRFSNPPFIGRDNATTAVLKMLKEASREFRNAFRVIGYFEAGGEKCVLSYNAIMPTFLLMAKTTDGSVVKLEMFDAHIADGWESRVETRTINSK